MLSKLNGGRFQVTCCTSSRTRASAKGWRSRRIRGRENSPRRESGTRPLTWWAFRRERRYYSWMRSSGGEHDANQALDRVQSAKLAFLLRTSPKRQLPPYFSSVPHLPTSVTHATTSVPITHSPPQLLKRIGLWKQILRRLCVASQDVLPNRLTLSNRSKRPLATPPTPPLRSP
jgi:hypothetical protein